MPSQAGLYHQSSLPKESVGDRAVRVRCGRPQALRGADFPTTSSQRLAQLANDGCVKNGAECMEQIDGQGSKFKTWGCAGFSLWCHLPRCHFGTTFLSNSQMTRICLLSRTCSSTPINKNGPELPTQASSKTHCFKCRGNTWAQSSLSSSSFFLPPQSIVQKSILAHAAKLQMNNNIQTQNCPALSPQVKVTAQHSCAEDKQEEEEKKRRAAPPRQASHPSC